MTTHMTQHYQSLQRMYLSAPINQLYLPEIVITEGEARIGIELREDFHHAAGAVHGSVYFKMLDDAAYFAVSSLEPEFFMLTASFTTYLIRPVSSGVMRSEGRVVSRTRSQFIAESVVYDGRGR
ncbi:PaaI family thioesterase [Sedimenticola selenatireducens]|uniref:PaaI family thioesterase n=2 Tax=Sedimenticola TaxID=349742 RepID=UPI0026AE3809